MATLRELYSPSVWSKKLPADRIVDHHIKTLLEATEIAQKTVKCELNVHYDDPEGPTLDIYYPPDGQESGDVFIYIHGGYWQLLGTEHSGFFAVPFTKSGIIVVALGYDLAPKANMTTIVEQCRKGCDYIIKKFPDSSWHLQFYKRIFKLIVFQEWVYVGGHSAGAHLSACLLAMGGGVRGGGVRGGGEASSTPFAGAVLVSGIYELGPIQRCYVNDPLQLTNTELQLYSPQRTLDQLRLPPGFSCFFANGQQESPAFKTQVEEYMKGLIERGVSCVHHEIADEDHFSITERLSESDYCLTKMILGFFSSHR